MGSLYLNINTFKYIRGLCLYLDVYIRSEGYNLTGASTS